MDQRQLHSLVEAMVNYSQDAPPVQPVQRRRVINYHDHSKRLATYFPSKVSFNTKWNFSADDDDESTWEFSAPVAPSSRSSSCSTSGTNYSTPAQEIVIRYRANLPLDSPDTRSSTSSASSDDSWEIAPPEDANIPLDYASVVAERDLKAVHRRSRLAALEETVRFRSISRSHMYEFVCGQREEAMASMKKHGLGEHDGLVCHRPGCRDTLRDVKALMFHLHIHNIHDQYV